MKNLRQFLFIAICMTIVLTGGCSKKDAKEADTSSAGATVEAVTETADSTDTAVTEEPGEEAAVPETEEESVEILVAAAASLQNSMEELGKLYKAANPNITVTFTFGSSGTLQEQIEQGAPIDVFMSAALKQMTALEEKGLILSDTKKELLENKVVLIVPKDSALDITGFEDILKAPTIALGDPESVPVGQYSEEIFTSLNMLDDVKKQANYAKDVTEVLTWVSTGNAEAGVVYATDAMSSKDVTVIAEAPEGSTSKVLYPVAIVKDTKVEEAAKAFVDYLASDEALGVFEKYGFSPNK
jgi:molybdate transport system substrate-binding protein